MSTLRRNRSDSVMVRTETVTTHVVDVDLADLLASVQADLADTVVLVIQTPSGRTKRVTLNPNFLIPPHHVGDEEWDARL